MTHQCTCSGPRLSCTNKLVSQWEAPMREFWESRKEKCKGETPVTEPSTYVMKDFLTGSSYEGAYEDMNMRGYGEYTFPNGVLYRGQFESGMCHGDGELVYHNGPEKFTVLRGKWDKGILNDCRILFNGILEYNEEDWKYCKMPDRRYSVEFNKELQPAGKSNITADQPPREIPPGFIDTGYGFYNPETKVIHKYDDMLDVSKAAYRREQIWMEEKCRMETTRKIGPRPDLYETWLEPDLQPQPLPDLLVTFTEDQRSLFPPDADTNTLFYDATLWSKQ